MPLVGSGILLEVALDRTGEERQRLDAAREERQRARIRGGHGDPGGDRFVDRVARERRAARPQLGELLGLELAEAEEVRDLGMAIDRDDRQRLRQAATREAREQANERELIEQVVLEPQDELVGVGGLVDAAVPLGEPARRRRGTPRVAQNSPRRL